MTRLAVVGMLLGSGTAWADEEDEPAPAPEPAEEPAPAPPAGDDDKPDEPAPAQADDGKPDAAGAPDADGDGDADDGKPAAVQDEAAAEQAAETDSDGDGISNAEEAAYADVDVNAPDSDGDGTPDAQEDGDIDNDGVLDAQEEDPPTDPFDADGDGKLEPDEIADRQEFAGFFDDIPNVPDEAALDARSEDAELTPSITVDDFRKGIRIVKKIVLDKMGKKIAKKSDDKMAKFTMLVQLFSLAGILLLFAPLLLLKKYPGQGKVLFKYAALAAVTFVVTVNLFGAVLAGMRTAQGALSNYTNPQLAIAGGTFDVLDHQADKFIVMGKELFLPIVEQFRNETDQQPATMLIENVNRIMKDVSVFKSIAGMFKKVDFVFGVLPIVLTFVTLILFVLAIKPTIIEIVKLPAVAAAGNTAAGKEVVAKSMRRVKGELLATLCTLGVLTVLTFLSSFVLGRIVGPALDALLTYLSLTVTYLQFAEGASSGLVFVTLFGVIFFLVMNLATLILSMSFFIGKTQKIFQARFNDGTPIATHIPFFRWGVPSVLLVQIFPLLFSYLAAFGLDKITQGAIGELNAENVSWLKILLAAPMFLVVAFAGLFWAARGVKAIKFLATYKVKPKA